MIRRPASSRWSVWAFVAALLLKAAMPMLADASARQQGKDLFEVCTVYGVALEHPGHGGPNDPDGDPAPHHAEHCALTALGALAFGDAPLAAVVALRLQGEVGRVAFASSHAVDAAAAWAARRWHGPPAVA